MGMDIVSILDTNQCIKGFYNSKNTSILNDVVLDIMLESLMTEITIQ